MAQPVEHLVRDQEAVRSNRITPTIFYFYKYLKIPQNINFILRIDFMNFEIKFCKSLNSSIYASLSEIKGAMNIYLYLMFFIG